MCIKSNCCTQFILHWHTRSQNDDASRNAGHIREETNSENASEAKRVFAERSPHGTCETHYSTTSMQTLSSETSFFKLLIDWRRKTLLMTVASIAREKISAQISISNVEERE
jgi:hypothetical protein